ncbi:MAG: von Willebrand factor type A domain-containing protein, partial [Victivallales bacterium]
KQKPYSTFSIDVDTASYTMARKLLRNGQKPESFSVRPEEFINYFDYHYRSPSNSTFAVYLESAPSVFRPENYTLRVGVKARELGPDGSRPSVFTILIDASGSMARENRLDLVKKTLPLLFDPMRPDDKVAVFTCTHRAINIVDYLPVKEKRTIIKLVEGIMPAGVADIENGLVTAYDSALRHYVSGAYNRVILVTDGISNIGTHSAEAILAKVSSARNTGITNTVIALGGDGDDKFLETIANKGDGNYVYMENEESARELFVNEFTGRFREIARDVKIQVEFNPVVVSQYRQVGYQNRQLSKADFRNDKVDAGEVGAGQSVTALYEMKLNKAFPSRNDDASIDNPINYSICIVRLRYRRADNMDVEEKEFPLAYHELKFNFDKASCGFRLAASVAEFAEFLRYPDVPGIANPENIMRQVQGVIGEDYRNDGKVAELYSLIKNVK